MNHMVVVLKSVQQSRISDLCHSVLLMRQRGNCTLAGEKNCFVLAFKLQISFLTQVQVSYILQQGVRAELKKGKLSCVLHCIFTSKSLTAPLNRPALQLGSYRVFRWARPAFSMQYNTDAVSGAGRVPVVCQSCASRVPY